MKKKQLARVTPKHSHDFRLAFFSITIICCKVLEAGSDVSFWLMFGFGASGRRSQSVVIIIYHHQNTHKIQIQIKTLINPHRQLNSAPTVA